MSGLTKRLFSAINSFGNLMTSFSSELKMFKDDVVEADISLLRSVLLEFYYAYENNYKEVRNGAAKYLSDAITCSRDLSIEMLDCPSTFETFYDAQWFYTSLSLSLNKCSLSIRTAVTYLLRVGKDEAMPHNHHVPNSFHLNQPDAKICTELYSNILEIMKRITLVVAHIKQSVSYWLDENSNKIASSVYENLAQVIWENNTDTIITNDATYNANETQLYVGLWELIGCQNCTSANDTGSLINSTVWLNLIDSFNFPTIKLATNCLLNYEETLLRAVNLTEQKIGIPPYLLSNNTVGDTFRELDAQQANISSLITFYLAGNITGMDTAKKAKELLLLTSNNLVLMTNEWEKMTQVWLNDINYWQSGVSALYFSIINGVLSLSKFFSKSGQLPTQVSKMKIWYKPAISIDPIIDIDFDAINENSADNILSALQTFLERSAHSKANWTMANVYNTIYNSVLDVAAKTQTARNEWSNQQILVDVLLDEYVKSVNINDEFVRY